MDNSCQRKDDRNPMEKISKSAISRNWFMSLSRWKKSNSTNINNLDNTARTSSECNLKVQDKKPKKEDKNVFQKIKRKMQSRFPSRHIKVINIVSDLEPTISLDETINVEKLTAHQEASTSKSLNDHYRTTIAKKWLEQESGPNVVMFKACSEMISHGWYWGEISRQYAQTQLTDKPNGSFLVRDSETRGPQFTLSFRTRNCTLHYRIQHRDNYWHFEELHYDSMVELIEDILFKSTDENFVCYVKIPNEMQPPFPVMLKYPVSRYLKIPTLQDMCRKTIQQYIQPEKIETLPIPVKLHEFLLEKSSLIF